MQATSSIALRNLVSHLPLLLRCSILSVTSPPVTLQSRTAKNSNIYGVLLHVSGCGEGLWRCPTSGVCIEEQLRCEAPLLLNYTQFYESYEFWYQYRPRYCNCPASREAFLEDPSDVICEDELHCGTFTLNRSKMHVLECTNIFCDCRLPSGGWCGLSWWHGRVSFVARRLRSKQSLSGRF